MDFRDIEKEMNYCSIFRTIVCVGDSLSSGEVVSVSAEGNYEYHDWFEYSWGQFIARETGAKVYNFSRGGMSASEYVNSFAEQNRFWDPAYAGQAYIIALGVNDLLGLQQEIGDIKDIDLADCEKNKKTFAGDYAKIIQRYKKIQPRAPFFLITMPAQYDDNEFVRQKKEQHQQLLYKFAETFAHTYVIDLWGHGPEYDLSFSEKYMMNGHMTVAGYLFSAKLIMKLMNEIILENLKNFNDSCFVGTDLYSKR